MLKCELFSNKYKVYRLKPENVDEIYELEKDNTLYFEYCPPFVTKQGILEDMKALPPGKSMQDQYYVGFYGKEKLLAIMNLIDGYPEKEIAYIGLFMMDVSVQKRGVGTEMIEDLCAYLAENGFAAVRLAWIKGNPQAEHFWLKNKFLPIKETTSNAAEKVILAERLLNERNMTMKSICGMDCCEKCNRLADCGGCIKADGKPFGGRCIAADYIKKGGMQAFVDLKNTLIDEFNALGIEDLQVTDLNLLNGFYINLEYQFSNGQSVKLLEDGNIYFGNQIERPGNGRCYGLAADDKYLLVCEYGCNGAEPEIVLFKRR